MHHPHLTNGSIERINNKINVCLIVIEISGVLIISKILVSEYKKREGVLKIFDAIVVIFLLNFSALRFVVFNCHHGFAFLRACPSTQFGLIEAKLDFRSSTEISYATRFRCTALHG